MIGRALFIVIFAYLFVVGFMYMTQRFFQYRPDTSYPGNPKENGIPELQQVELTTEDGVNLYAWFAAPRDPDGKIFVIYHGNAGNLAKRINKARALVGLGYGVYMCEYRGYGGNKGSPSEEGFYADGRAALRWLEQKGYKAGQFVLYGESIGSGVATQMALEYQAKYLVLEGAFSSAIDVAEQHYYWLPNDLLLKDKYDNAGKIKNIKTSLLMMHGGHDNVVDIALARKLFEAANHPKEFVEINSGGHVDLFEHGADKVIKNWLERK